MGGDGKRTTGTEFPIIIHRVYGIEFPQLSHFGDVPAGERRSRRLVIRSANGREFKVQRVHTDNEAFSALGDAGESRKAHFLEVAFQGLKPGAYEGHLIVETDHPDCPTLKIDLAAAAVATDFKAAAGSSEAAPRP